MYRTTRLLLRPTRKQEVALARLLEFQRELYNAALQERRGTYRWERSSLSLFEQAQHLTGWPQEFGRAPALGTLLRLDRSFCSFFRRVKRGERPGYPRFKAYTRWSSVEYPSQHSWKVSGDQAGRLYLQGIGHISYRTSKRGVCGAPKTLVVKHEGRRWWALVVCEVEARKPLPRSGRSIGVDLGITQLLATSEGEFVPNPRWFSEAADRLAAAQRSLRSKRLRSNRRRKAVERVAKAHRKVRNQRRDAHHQISRVLVDSCDLIVHEALQINKMTRSPKPRPNEEGGWDPNGAAQKSGLNRAIKDAGWGQLLRFIAYKAEEAGREVIAVAPQYTSQRCFACGHTEAANRAGIAFRCRSCGHEAHADVNAAKNILRAGLAQRLAA